MNLKELYMNEAYSDVTFFVGQDDLGVWRFPAHSLVLKLSSPVFDRMLSGNFKETQTGEIRITDIRPSIFKEVVSHVYLGQISIDSMKMAFKLLNVAQKYFIKSLVNECVNFIEQNVNETNVLYVLERLRFVEEKNRAELLMRSLFIVDIEIRNILQKSKFADLDASIVRQVVERDSLKQVLEVEIFDAVCRWARNECCRQNLPVIGQNIRMVLGDIFYQIRFLTMTRQELQEGPFKSKLLTDDERDCFTMRHLSQNFQVPPGWDIKLLERERYTDNIIKRCLWSHEGELKLASKSQHNSTLFVFTCDVILYKLKFVATCVCLAHKVSVEVEICDLDGNVLATSRTVADHAPLQHPKLSQGLITVCLPVHLKAYHCYEIRVSCFEGNLCSKSGKDQSTYENLIPFNGCSYFITCEKKPEDIEKFKSSEYWVKYFTPKDSNLMETREDNVNLNTVISEWEVFVVKRGGSWFDSNLILYVRKFADFL